MKRFPTKVFSPAWIWSGLTALCLSWGSLSMAQAQTTETNSPLSPEDVRQQLADSLRADPGNSELNLAYGLHCLSMERYSHAALAFERLLFLNPANDRARIELARACFLLGQLDESRLQFERVLAGNPPESVRQNIAEYLAAMDERQTKWRFSGRIEAGMLYDDNVNYGPASQIIGIAPVSMNSVWIDQLQLAPESMQKSAWGSFAVGTLLFSYHPRPDRPFSINGYSRLESDNYDDASEYDLLVLQTGVGPRFQRGSHALHVPARFEYLLRDGATLASVVGLAPAYYWQMVPTLGLSLSANFDYRDYADSSDRDGLFGSLGAQATQSLGTRAQLVGGLRLIREVPDAAIWRNFGWEAFLGATVSPMNRLTCFFNASYRANDYDEQEVLAPSDRKDQQGTFSVGASWLFTKRWGLNLSTQYTLCDSTFDLYEYDRLATKGSVSYDF